MAEKKKEERDGLFNMNLGDGFIEIDETPTDDQEQQRAAGEDGQGEEGTEKETVQGNYFQEHEDGTIEIDEHLQKTIAAQAKPEGDNDDDESGDGTDFENSDEEKKKRKASSDGDESGDSSPSSSQYLAFARDRAEEGVFLDFNEEDWKVLMERNNGDEAAALRELSDISMQTMIQQGIEAYKESLTDEDRALYEAKEKGLPIDAYGMAKRNLDKYSKIKVEDMKENEKLQEEVVSKVLEIRGFSKEEIAEEIENYKTLEVLGSKAEKALPLLPKKFQKDLDDMEQGAKAQDEARKDRIRQGVARMKRMVEQTPEIIPGIKLNKSTREKILQSMIEPVARDTEGNPMNPVMATRSKNPDAFEMMIHYYHSLGLFNIDEDGNMKPDFSKITKTAKKEATDSMRSIFEAKPKATTGKPKKVSSQQDEEDDWEQAFRRI